MNDTAPVLLALQVCDAIHRDPETGKRTLLGQWNERELSEFPASIRVLWIHVALTECPPSFSHVLDLIRSEETDEPVSLNRGRDYATSPLEEIQFDVRIRKIDIASPGEYLLRFLVEGQLVGTRKLIFTER